VVEEKRDVVVEGWDGGRNNFYFAWKRGGSTEYFDNLNCDQLGTFDFQNVPNG